MTWRDVGQRLLGSWPDQVARWGPEAMAAYVQELERRGVTPELALIALDREHGDFPPSAPKLALSAQLSAQGLPPTFMEAHALITARITTLPYHDPESGMPRLVERLQEEGHEAVARFALAMGARGLREMPDPRASLTQSASVSLTRIEKEYREYVGGWEADPTPGLAAAEARQIAERSEGGMRTAVAELEAARDAG